MSDINDDISVRTLYSRALHACSTAYALPTIEDDTQAIVNSALVDLSTLSSRLNALHIFSPNESLDDVTTGDLIYMTVPFVFAEMVASARVTKKEIRQSFLKRAGVLFKQFVALLHDYGVVPEEEIRLFSQQSTTITDPSKRRETKIAQYKKEKEIKASILAIRSQRSQPELDMNNNYDLVASLIPAQTADDVDDENETTTREITFILLRLESAIAATQLNSIEQELELLRNAPPEEPQSNPPPDTSWTLDAPGQGLLNSRGPLLDRSGKPLRPFQILPSSAASDRTRLQAEVFRPDHRLPSMTIDEYLEEEQRRGNIISGGGPQSSAAPTRKEQLKIDAEMDGTRVGDEKAEEKREEDERWARYTDANPRGAGNTMNRG